MPALLAERQVIGFRGRKRSVAIENASRGLDLRRSVKQQVLQRWVQIPAYNQAALFAIS
jgi:hypothetical protein